MKKPLTLVFWNFACSCCVLPALQYSTWHKCLRKQSTNMSKPKHAKSCQDTTWQTYINKQASNMAVYLLKQKSKASDSNIRCSNHKCLQCTIRSILCTKHAKSCQDTTCQTNIDNQASNMAAYPLKQSQKL